MIFGHLDFETFSTCNIKVAGGYRYAEDPSTQVLIACYSLGGPVKTFIPIGSSFREVFGPFKTPGPRYLVPKEFEPFLGMPTDLFNWIDMGKPVKAHNAAFEAAIWDNVMRRDFDAPKAKINQWYCTAAQAAAAGLPRALGKGIECLNRGLRARPGDANYIPEKDKAGDKFIKTFCVPRKPSKKDPRTRLYASDQPDQFQIGVVYCQQDVISEHAYGDRIPALSRDEQRNYWFDMMMNKRGMPLDLQSIQNANAILTGLEQGIKQRVNELTKELTGESINPTQGAKILALAKALEKSIHDDSEVESELTNMRAGTVTEFLNKYAGTAPPALVELLQLRMEASKASTKKLGRMIACAGKEDRVRGGFLYHGAHTGRASGQLIQPQNFKRGFGKKPAEKKAFDDAFDMMCMRDPWPFQVLYDSPIDAISKCMRGFIRAEHGHRFLVVDYASIEVRVLMWLAQQDEMLDALRDGKDLYKVQASGLYNVKYEEVTEAQRHMGKQLILGCGYQLGAQKFVDYAWTNGGTVITIEFAVDAVKSYRSENSKVVQLWFDVEKCAVDAVKYRRDRDSPIILRNMKFFVEDVWLIIQLPSGREFRYPFPDVNLVEVHPRQWPEESDEDFKARLYDPKRKRRFKDQLSFQTLFKNQPVRETTYGGKLVENITQAVARDVMQSGMWESEKAGYPVIGIVHDEVITEVVNGQGSLHELELIVCKIPSWAEGMPLKAEGFETIRYRKG